jgi:hypothetical protein
MLNTILIVVTLALIAAILELPPLIKKAFTKEVITYSVMLIIGSILSVAALQEIQIPSPMKVPEMIYKPLYEWMQQTLKIKDG